MTSLILTIKLSENIAIRYDKNMKKYWPSVNDMSAIWREMCVHLYFAPITLIKMSREVTIFLMEQNVIFNAVIADNMAPCDGRVSAVKIFCTRRVNMEVHP